MNQYTLCRLCGAEKLQDNVLCLDDQIKHEVLKSKIFHCLQIQITSNDKLPQTVCTLCIDKVEDFYNFYLNAQKLHIMSYHVSGICTNEPKFSKSLQCDSKLNQIKPNEEWRHYQWKCSDCPGVFEAMDDLRIHYHNYHNKPTTYTCHICGKTFKMFRNLERHTKACQNKKKHNKKIQKMQESFKLSFEKNKSEEKTFDNETISTEELSISQKTSEHC